MMKNGHNALPFEITRHELTLPRLSPAFDGYRLVQISDIHMGTWINRTRLLAAVAAVNELKPDAVAITGDFVSFTPERYIDDLVGGLSELAAPDGSFAVLGNHDHWTDPELVAQMLTASGTQLLRNRVHTIPRGAATLHLAGVDCYYERQDRLDLVLERLPAAGSAILLVHEPDFADVSAATGRFDLELSGHSHGGQMILPWIGPPILPQFAAKYPVGKYHINGMIHYTNRGLGTARVPVRINCPPEITLFVLRSPESRSAE